MFVYLILGFVVVLLFFDIFVLVQFSILNASAGPIYMAGIKIDEMCDCPVLVGDYVCKIRVPK
ncbi:MAG: hypothetical protein ACUVUG_08125 [Candidatus Aminicenantia bacterium]